jgi:predicted Zn-dependent protease
MFYHPVLKFQFPTPQGWLYQNSPQMVQFADKEGKALIMFTLAQGSSLQQAATTAMQQYKLQVVESQNTSVNGMPAMYVVADQVNPQRPQATIRTISYFIQYNGSIYHFIGVSNLSTFNNYTSYFSNTMQNFRALTDPAKLNKKPERIRIKTVGANTTLSQALRDFGMPQNRLEELAILNGMKLTDNLSKGTLIKITAQ